MAKKRRVSEGSEQETRAPRKRGSSTSGRRSGKAAKGKANQRLSNFVGRSVESEILSGEIEAFARSDAYENHLRVVPISGFGGIGKTTLLQRVLDEHPDSLADSLVLWVSRSTVQDPFDFISYIDAQFAPSKLPNGYGRKEHDYFPQTRHLIRLMRRLERDVDEDLKNSGLSQGARLGAKMLYKARPLIGQMGPKAKVVEKLLAVMEMTRVDESAAELIDKIGSLASLQKKKSLMTRLRKESTADLKDDPYECLAQTWIGDLSAILSNYRFADRFKLTHRSIEGLNRLILVVDDYETTGDILAPFLLGGVIRGLREAEFPTLVVMIGRDNLSDSKDENVAWSQHHGDILAPQVTLDPLSAEESAEMLTNAGYNKTQAKQIHGQTQGIPELLRFFADNQKHYGNDAAVYYQEFYQRTTRWMTKPQKRWLMATIYLDAVNQGTVEVMLPDEDPELVVDWFRSEGSVRDKSASEFVAAPVVREMLLKHDRNVRGAKRVKVSEDLAELAMKHA